MYKSQKTRCPRSPFTVRFCPDELAELTSRAISAGMSIGGYIRHQLFGSDRTIRRTRGRNPIQDQEALGQVLAALGRTRDANNLNQIAKAANYGALELDDEARAALLEACANIHEMRGHLVMALGVNEKT
ncbi:Uncharacterised protein [Halioglobus japonicus]|nr:Uncharacterised protein [Halioglobus japonicus]